MILSYVVSAESCTLCFPHAPFYDTSGTMLTILMMLKLLTMLSLSNSCFFFFSFLFYKENGGNGSKRVVVVIILYLPWICALFHSAADLLVCKWIATKEESDDNDLIEVWRQEKNKQAEQREKRKESYNKRSDYVKDCGGKHEDGSSPLLMSHKSAWYE